MKRVEAGTVLALHPLRLRPAGEREVQVEARNELGREVLLVARVELREGRRCVEVVEGGRAARRLEQPVGDRDAPGHARAEHVAVHRVPGDVAPEEERVVPALP
ncbi:MAG TPA: hypothetical protein VFK62_08870 [Gaiellaceae bacterium]|nr:hypothetical protein [Gaiellaceae bacterium]